MPLTLAQQQLLDHAINHYSFPLEYYDFATHSRQVAANAVHLEGVIQAQLASGAQQDVADGLANIIYWGNATAGYRDWRFSRFRSRIGAFAPYAGFSALLASGTPTLGAIKKLGYPTYSGISFVSKILMFLDPQNYCVLDLQISKLRQAGRASSRALDGLKLQQTSIPVTAANERVYDGWRQECLQISRTYYAGRHRAADVERGFFTLIQGGRLTDAQGIYSDF